MTSRDAILNRIRTALAHEPPQDRPPAPEVWPRLDPSRDDMAKRFIEELQAVHGEAYRVGSMTEARAKLVSILAEQQAGSLVAMDRPLCRELLSPLAPLGRGAGGEGPGGKGAASNDSPLSPCGRGAGGEGASGPDNASPPAALEILYALDDPKPTDLAQIPLGVIEADVLLADTGSSMIACRTPGDRLLCYLPPACVVVAPIDRLFEHLPAAWPVIAPRAADPDTRGEFVFITGPSRTADIEKILILGVHGPQRLVVLLVG